MRVFIIIAAALAALLVQACGLLGPQIPEVTVKGTEYSFDMPEQIGGGLLLITFQNDGKRSHNVQFARLKDGKTPEDFRAALPKGPAGILLFVDVFIGGAELTPAGERRQMIFDFPPGTYAMISSARDEGNVPDVEKGMVRFVTATSPNQALPEPTAPVTVTLKDSVAIGLSGDIKAGKQTWRVNQEGTTVHRFAIAKVLSGKNEADLAAWLKTPSGPPPAEFVGGVHLMSPGRRGWTIMDLTPGSYVAFDDSPGPVAGKPTSFTVR